MYTIFETIDRNPSPVQHSGTGEGLSWGQHLASVSGASQERLQQLSSIHLLKLIEDSIKIRPKATSSSSVAFV